MRQLRRVTAGLILMIFMVLSLTGCEKSLEEQIAEQLELGQKYLSELNYEEAIVAFTKAIELEEKTEAAYVGLAEAYEGKGDVWQATQTLEMGYELFPEEDMKNSLAEIYKRALEFFAEDMERQIEIYHRLIELFPDEEYYQKLAEIYEMQDNMEAAKKILEDGIAATDSEELKENLEELNGPPKLERVTVEGVIWDLMEVYGDSVDRYMNLYTDFGHPAYVLRFLEPVEVTIEGEVVSVSETGVGQREKDLSEKIEEICGQTVRLTGFFSKKEGDGEIPGPYYDENKGIYYYDPTGPYRFTVEELTLISQ